MESYTDRQRVASKRNGKDIPVYTRFYNYASYLGVFFYFLLIIRNSYSN